MILILKYLNSRKMLAIFGVCASLFTLGTVMIQGMAGLYSLVMAIVGGALC